MKNETLRNIHDMKDVCNSLNVSCIKKKATEFVLNKNGKVILYNAGQNKCFWYQDNVWGEVSNITNFIKFEYQ